MFVQEKMQTICSTKWWNVQWMCVYHVILHPHHTNVEVNIFNLFAHPFANVQLQQLPGPRRFVINCRTKSLHLVTTTQGLPWKIICIICMIVIQKLYAWLCIDFRYQKWKRKHTWLCVCVSISMQVKNQIWLELQNLFGHQWWHYVNAKAISYVLWYYVTILTDRKSILNAA